MRLRRQPANKIDVAAAAAPLRRYPCYRVFDFFLEQRQPGDDQVEVFEANPVAVLRAAVKELYGLVVPPAAHGQLVELVVLALLAV